MILLIAPSHRRILSPPYMKTVQQGLGCLPPLGLLSIGGYLKNKTGHRINVLDALLDNMPVDDIENVVRKEEPDVVGVHAVTLALLDVIDVCTAVKRAAPKAVVVVGGPHVGIYPRETLALENVDYIVVGEGEAPFAGLVEYLKGKRAALPDGAYSKDSPPSWDVRPHIHQNLDALPHPDRLLTPYQRYQSVVSRHPPSTTIMGSRGCPFNCTFCYTAGGKKFRPRSPESIVEEMRKCLDLGIAEFFFFDETFTLDRDRVTSFCKTALNLDREVYWDVRGRVDLVDEEMLKWMKKAGCRRIQYGVESGSDKVLKRLKKGFSPDEAIKAFKMTKDAGIYTYADFMIGNPGETIEDLEKTFALAKQLDPDYVHYSITMPLPKTPLYNEALQEGIIREDYWQEFAKNPKEGFHVRYWEENFTSEELEALLRRGYREFYLRPGYVARSLANLASPGELIRKAKAGLKLFKDL